MRLVHGTWEAFEAAKKRKNLWVIMLINGHDETLLPEDDETEKALINHFGSSCGRTRRFEFGKDPFNSQGRCACIEVWGEEGVAKALELSGSHVAGLKILVKPARTHQEIYNNLPFGTESFGCST